MTLGIVLLLAEAFIPTKGKAWLGLAGSAGLLVILGLLPIATGPDGNNADWPLWNFYQHDQMAVFYKGFAMVTTILVLLMSVDYRAILSRFTDFPDSENGTGEYYSLPIFACAGMMWLASAKDLAGAFVALELVTITFYVMVAFMRRNLGSVEAGVKYLILGALSTGFLVYGIAWIYGTTHTLSFEQLATAIPAVESTTPLLFGIALVLIGLAFKVGAVPMQIWIPDVYQGAPTPTTAFLSVASKAAGFILLIRFLDPMLATSITSAPVLFILFLLTAATLIYGNLGAIAQSNFKRLLAYSSIAHAGFLLLALSAGKTGSQADTLNSNQVVSFYLATYLIMTLGAFFVMAQVRIQRDGEEISHFDGLGKTNPRLALALTVLMASMAGVPLTAGFVGKFLAFSIAIDAKLWLAIGMAFIGAAAGFYYYFKVIRAMWVLEPQDAAVIKVPVISSICISVLTVATIVLGFWPQPILWLIGY
ncbi:MAG: NADH-quinone oxidoreductase subunit N [Akkermansiaceae bacterium]|nr:NADH-quinone oxidoreductase subunit N [Akkermansiaceae bacterium]